MDMNKKARQGHPAIHVLDLPAWLNCLSSTERESAQKTSCCCSLKMLALAFSPFGTAPG
jgi:hypothetical protein